MSFPGLKDPQIALSLLALDPGLRGVLIGGPSGTGKTMVARAAAALLPKGKPFVNLPLGCTLERLVGGIDWEMSYRSGKLVPQAGLLAQAHGGFLYVDEINLLSPDLQAVLLQVLQEGEVRLEREGLSHRFPACFSLIGTFNPVEAELPSALSERVAFTVYTDTLKHLSWRVFLANQVVRGAPMELPVDIVQRVERARDWLPEVCVREEQVVKLCEMATQTGVEGNRAEVFALRCAKANAALHHRAVVTDSDIDLAVRLVYLSRLGAVPMPGEEELDIANISEKSSRKKRMSAPREPEQEESGPESKQPQQENYQGGQPSQPKNEGDTGEGRGQNIKDLPNLDVEKLGEVPLPTLSGNTHRVKKAGKHMSGLNFKRGRHTRSVPGLPSQGRIDVPATLKAALLNRPAGQSGIPSIKREDYRIKQYRQRSGLLFVFAVDGSGSMAINHFGAAKGAALSLLEKAYVYRDQVAMIYFRHKEANLLLAPGTSLSKASSALSRIPAGGRTPIAAALVKTIKLAQQALARREVGGVVLLLFTDGRANQPLVEAATGQELETAAMKELQPLCQAVKEHLDTCIVFDTRRSHKVCQSGRDLAHWLDARYIHLPRLCIEDITSVVDELRTDTRNGMA